MGGMERGDLYMYTVQCHTCTLQYFLLLAKMSAHLITIISPQGAQYDNQRCSLPPLKMYEHVRCILCVGVDMWL